MFPDAALRLQLGEPKPPRRFAENHPARLGFERQRFCEDAKVLRVGNLRRPQVIREATGPHAALRSVSVNDLQARGVKVFAGVLPRSARADEVQLWIEIAET